jgi:hypothetical protein
MIVNYDQHNKRQIFLHHPAMCNFGLEKSYREFFRVTSDLLLSCTHLPETLDLTDGEGYNDEQLEARQTIERGVYAKTLCL